MAIESSLMSGPARELFTRITSDSDRFTNAMIDFITRLYPTTKKTSRLFDKIIWELCLELLAYILDEIIKARNGFLTQVKHSPLTFCGVCYKREKFSSVTSLTTS
jgi:hypothetical protein